MTIHTNLTDGPGYDSGQRLNELELVTIREMITEHYLERIRILDPNLLDQAAELGLAGYHLLPRTFDHASAWPKKTRILPLHALPILKHMGFFQVIEKEYGPVLVSDDDLNWRIVRPGFPEDVGPVHADHWFWDIGYGVLPEGCDRFKIWIPICTEPGYNGLCVKPFSQLRDDWKHHTETRHDMLKPVLDENVEELNMQLLPLVPGQILMFHDKLLHGGAINRGQTCRVSLELTIFFRTDCANLSTQELGLQRASRESVVAHAAPARGA